MSIKSHKRKLTKAERNALRQAMRVGLSIKQAMPLPRLYLRGYTDGLRAMADLLPHARYYVNFHRRMDRLDKQFNLKTVNQQQKAKL